MRTDMATAYNASKIALEKIPVLSINALRQSLFRGTQAGGRLVALFGVPGESVGLRLYAVLADNVRGTLHLAAADVGDSYPSLTPDCHAAHWFEREIAEQWGVCPEGHPWLKPIRFHTSNRAKASAPPTPGITEFYHVEGDAIHEVSVGPVHAGIIEPGHFRFQCHGETVLHLEIALGYQHRGIERALVGGPNKRTVHYMETLAGDTTIGHATAYAHTVEALAGSHPPMRGQALRAIALELERLANHTGDLGAMAGDVGYLPTSSFCGRIRGDFLNMTAILCGNRFGRGLVRPGGAQMDIDPGHIVELLRRIEKAKREVTNAVELLWNTPSVQARFEGTGAVSESICHALGLVGPAARACGVEHDVRVDFPTGLYAFAHIPVATWHTGDVLARALVRWLEVDRSLAFIQEQLNSLPEGKITTPLKSFMPHMAVVSLVEGWRGEICHVALTDAQGRFSAYKVVDPSFHNWMGLAMALRDQQISDFPLCNKSFNLSYCGHDL